MSHLNFSIVQADNKAFLDLVKLLDQSLAKTDGEEHAFYDQFNGIDTLAHLVVGYLDGQPVSCGAIKQRSSHTAEVKRMFTMAPFRGRGIGSALLAKLEAISKDHGYQRLILETGKRQPDAIALYEKNGFNRIQNYEPYIGMANSVCFEKML